MISLSIGFDKKNNIHLNLKLMTMLEYQNIKIFFQKVTSQIVLKNACD